MIRFGNLPEEALKCANLLTLDLLKKYNFIAPEANFKIVLPEPAQKRKVRALKVGSGSQPSLRLPSFTPTPEAAKEAAGDQTQVVERGVVLLERVASLIEENVPTGTSPVETTTNVGRQTRSMRAKRPASEFEDVEVEIPSLTLRRKRKTTVTLKTVDPSAELPKDKDPADIPPPQPVLDTIANLPEHLRASTSMMSECIYQKDFEKWSASSRADLLTYMVTSQLELSVVSALLFEKSKAESYDEKRSQELEKQLKESDSKRTIAECALEQVRASHKREMDKMKTDLKAAAAAAVDYAKQLKQMEKVWSETNSALRTTKEELAVRVAETVRASDEIKERKLHEEALQKENATFQKVILDQEAALENARIENEKLKTSATATSAEANAADLALNVVKTLLLNDPEINYSMLPQEYITRLDDWMAQQFGEDQEERQGEDGSEGEGEDLPPANPTT